LYGNPEHPPPITATRTRRSTGPVSQATITICATRYRHLINRSFADLEIDRRRFGVHDEENLETTKPGGRDRLQDYAGLID